MATLTIRHSQPSLISLGQRRGLAMPPLLLTVLMIVTTPATGPQAAPVRYGGPECGVSVASPHRLKHERSTVAAGTATTHFYTAKVRGTTFKLFCIRDQSIAGPSDELYATYRDGFLDDDPNQLVAERAVMLDGVVGREVHGAEPKGTHSVVRVFIVPGRSFGAMVQGSQEDVSSEEATRFLDSIQFER
jgi:hypothetical protein